MKKEYIAPSVEMVNLDNESLLYTASPGIGGDYDPDMPIDAKPGVFDEDIEWDTKPVNVWSEEEED